MPGGSHKVWPGEGDRLHSDDIGQWPMLMRGYLLDVYYGETDPYSWKNT